MIIVKGSVGNALATSLNESFRNLVMEGTHRDVKGDQWSSHTAFRNEFHPNFEKSKNQPDLDGVAYEEQARQVFLNHRSKSIHEGPMLLHPDKKVAPFSHSGNAPQLFHQEHYFFAE